MPEELKKSLGFPSVYALILTSMIGTSLFFGITAGAQYAGVSSLLSWVLLGAITLYVAACFAELTAMFPSSGGVYEFTKQAYGRFPSFLVGWITWIVANIGVAVLVVAALDFLIPGAGALTIGTLTLEKSLAKFICAVVLILFFNSVTYRGIEASGKLLLGFAVIMLVLLLGIIIPSFGSMQASNFSGIVWHPLVIFAAMFFIVESFFGWEAASFLAEEIEDAPRVIPKALLWASATVVLLGIALAVVSFGNFGAQALTTLTNPVLTLGTGLSSNLSVLIIIGVFLTFLGGVVGAVVSSPRLLLALSRDKLFVEQCGHIHPVHKTPSNAIIFQTIVTILAVIVAFGEYNLLLSLLVPLALIMYAAVLLSVPVLRAKLPKHERPFRVWGGSWLPVFVAALYVCVIVAWYTTTPGAANIALVIGGFLLLAFPIYLFLTIVYNPDAIISLSNGSARINYFLEDFLFPRKVRREVLDLFKGHLRGKEIVEFGSGVGTFTMHLAEEVGPQGSVVAIDLSRMNLDILERRLRERGHSHVRVLHDEHQVNRLHPDIHQADMIYSVGFLGYVQDLHKILHEMHAILAPGGKICFVEYTNFFQILPDPAIVSDHARLQRIFAEAGFSVSITKRNGFLWDYLIIHGIKTDGKVPFV